MKKSSTRAFRIALGLLVLISYLIYVNNPPILLAGECYWLIAEAPDSLLKVNSITKQGTGEYFALVYELKLINNGRKTAELVNCQPLLSENLRSIIVGKEVDEAPAVMELEPGEERLVRCYYLLKSKHSDIGIFASEARFKVSWYVDWYIGKKHQTIVVAPLHTENLSDSTMRNTPENLRSLVIDVKGIDVKGLSCRAAQPFYILTAVQDCRELVSGCPWLPCD